MHSRPAGRQARTAKANSPPSRSRPPRRPRAPRPQRRVRPSASRYSRRTTRQPTSTSSRTSRSTRRTPRPRARTSASPRHRPHTRRSTTRTRADVTHVIHPREEWIDPAGPPWDGFPAAGGGKYRCPPFPGWSKITDVVIHYPGADWADMDFDNDLDIDLDDDVEQIRAQHRMYVTSPTRGYSLGYCFLLGQTGGIWESRGWRNVNAANKGQASMGTTGWNGYSISIQLIVDEANAATPAQVDSVNWLLDELVRVSGKQLRLRYHGQGQATSCCGAGIIAQIKAGTINFGKSQPQPIPKPPPPGEDEMATTVFKPFDCAAQFV